MARFTLDGPAGQLLARGAKLPGPLVEALTEAKYDTGTDATGQLVLTFEDRRLQITNGGLFQAGTKTAAGSPLDWGARKMEVRAVELSEEGELTITARSLGVCKLQRARGVLVATNTTPTDWVKAQATAAGLKFVGEASPTRPQVTRQADESSWDTIKRLGNELGYLAFEADGCVYFGRPSWFVSRPGAPVLNCAISGADWQPVDPRILSRPSLRTSGDADVKAAELSVDVLPELGQQVDPGWVLNVTGLQYMGGRYMVDKVSYPLDDQGVVSVSASTPINPTPQPPAAATSSGGSSSGDGKGYVFSLSVGWTGGTGLGNPGAGTYGGVKLNAEQVGNAVGIVKQGIADNVPTAGLIIAVMTAMQESTLHNINYGDRDSIGLFQQRNAWASNAERRDVAKTAHLFFTGGHAGQKGLLDIKGWQQMSKGQAAQKVQVSAFPNAYAKWEKMATALVSAILRTSKPMSSADLAAQSVTGPTAEAFVRLCLAQAGDRYIFGHEVKLSDPDPDTFDCSELVEWAAYRCGIKPRVPDGSQAQSAHCRRITLAQASRTRGALLFNPHHVAVSLGTGDETIEAMGRKYGVLKGHIHGRTFTHGGLIPGMRYS